MALWLAQITLNGDKQVSVHLSQGDPTERPAWRFDEILTHAYHVDVGRDGKYWFDLYYDRLNRWCISLNDVLCSMTINGKEADYARDLFELCQAVPDPAHSFLHTLIFAASTRGTAVTIQVSWTDIPQGNI